ncbi:TonB-dependent receptor [Methylocystis bryophila]|uniref:TonB-dependent receptor n=1 Tax=Methylocystis bryophila TaxID=655015 RepID=A0A1W6MVS5_9HYPH|nr:TonB-dependent receptor [Methylocystis bryophila]ARN81703.1 TonB-dependent receptor [Methylocystis bryophila]BDV37752.1 TonB-dependent receptor [Methylocystis bryophila]
MSTRPSIRIVRAGAVSAVALQIALTAGAAYAQTTLPTIDVGGAKHVAHKPAPSAKPTTHVAAAPTRAAPERMTRPAPSRPAPHPSAPQAPLEPTPTPEQPWQEAAPGTQQPEYSDLKKPLTQPQRSDASSSVRDFSPQQVNARVFAQPGEALEIAPGLVVAQHSGPGKANQYFLRGFALDHGYDIGITFDGMNVNQPSHIHSNGYADTNFLIPELLSQFEVRKGPYFADEGVFSAVGAIHMNYIDKLREGLVIASGGSFGWGRLVGAKSWALGQGELFTALELRNYNGPWQRPDEGRVINGFARWSEGTQENGFSLTAMAYSQHYFATDQIPYNLVSEGLMSRWDTQDPTDGGNGARYSLSMRWSETNKNDWSRVEAYMIHNDTNLYDNFTYWQSNPASLLFQPLSANTFALGDQTHQFDHRQQYGLKAMHGWKYTLQGTDMQTRVGYQGLADFILNGNGDSFQRQQFDQISNNYIKEYIHGLWTDTTQFWTPWLRTTEGFRLDYVHGSVNSVANPTLALGSFPPLVPDPTATFLVPATPFPLGSLNNGELGRFFTSPKVGTVLGPYNNTELFVNFGEGLRAEDIRGALGHWTTDGGAYSYIPNVQLLTKTRGAETGLRSKGILPGLDATITLFWQDLDAEQTFNADTATSQYGRPGRRYGFEFTGNYEITSWAHADANVTGTHARFRGYDQQQFANWFTYLSGGVAADPLWPLSLPGSSPGNYLMLAPVWVSTFGLELGEKTGWFGALRGRYFGARPLTEDGQIESHATFTVNARLGYRFDNGWKVQVDGFNILNSRADMIDYAANVFGKQDFAINPWYVGGSAGIAQRTWKPIDPPAVRLTISGPLDFVDKTPIAPVLASY